MIQDWPFFYELIGYVASVLVAISLMMSKIISLRIVNAIGAATFCVYGILINSVPVASMNAFVVLINFYYLWKLYGSTEDFKLIQLNSGDDYIAYFLEFYADEIEMHQENGIQEIKSSNFIFLTLRNMVPAGILAGNLELDGTLQLKIDFVTPDYRDFKIGKFIYTNNLAFLKSKNIKTIQAKAADKEQENYFKKMGFEKSGASNFTLSI